MMFTSLGLASLLALTLAAPPPPERLVFAPSYVAVNNAPSLQIAHPVRSSHEHRLPALATTPVLYDKGLSAFHTSRRLTIRVPIIQQTTFMIGMRAAYERGIPEALTVTTYHLDPQRLGTSVRVSILLTLRF